MNRYFTTVTEVVDDSAVVGTSALCGPHLCDYRKCGNPYAQKGRFHAYYFANGRAIATADVCTPECAAAYNRYYFSRCDPESDAAQARHILLEKIYGRRIVPAPGPSRYQDVDRWAWLQVCRAQLSEEERTVADAELVVQRSNLHTMLELRK